MCVCARVCVCVYTSYIVRENSAWLRSSSFSLLFRLIGTRKYFLSCPPSAAHCVYNIYVYRRHLRVLSNSLVRPLIPLSLPITTPPSPTTMAYIHVVEMQCKVSIEILRGTHGATWNSGFSKLNGTRGLGIHFGVKCAPLELRHQVIIFCAALETRDVLCRVRVGTATVAALYDIINLKKKGIHSLPAPYVMYNNMRWSFSFHRVKSFEKCKCRFAYE
jgi:hypothetical protein